MSSLDELDLSHVLPEGAAGRRQRLHVVTADEQDAQVMNQHPQPALHGCFAKASRMSPPTFGRP
jgi:hypothetical protein